MKIKFKCECGKRIKASIPKIGRSLQCPLCQRKVKIPEPTASNVLSIDCNCGTSFSSDSKACPGCLQKVDLDNRSSDTEQKQIIIADQITIYYKIWAICILISLISIVYILFNSADLVKIFGK